MNIKELKENIINKSLNDDFLIFKWEDVNFLPLQYINEIAKNKNLELSYVDELSNGLSNDYDMFDSLGDRLVVLIVDTFSTNLDCSSFKNTIVVCKKVDDVLKEYVVEFPKIQEWQVIDLMRTKCRGLDDAILKWLYDITQGNIYRIVNEMDKISIFDKDQQESIFNLLNGDNGYVDLNPLNIFNLSNAILKKDYKTIGDVIRDIDNLDIEGTGLVTILKRNIKNIIDIQMNPQATPESLGMKVNQFRAIEYNCGKFSNNQLIDMYEFLTSIDFKLKNGELQMDNNQLVSYIICNILRR